MQVRLALDFYHPWPNNAPFFIARSGGFYRGTGLEVEIVCPDAGIGDGLAYLESGRADFAVSYPNRLMARVATGAGLRSVAALNQRPMESLVSLPRQPVFRAGQLKGLRVGYRRSARLKALLDWLVAADGVNPTQVTHVVLYPEEPMPAGLVAGEYDATFGALWAWEGLQGPVLLGTELVHREVDGLGAPSYPAQVLATRSTDASLVGAFVAATRFGAEEAARCAEAAVETLHEAAPFLPRALLEASLETVVPLWGGSQWGVHPQAPLSEYQAWLVGAGLLERTVDLTATFVDPGTAA